MLDRITCCHRKLPNLLNMFSICSICSVLANYCAKCWYEARPKFLFNFATKNLKSERKVYQPPILSPYLATTAFTRYILFSLSLVPLLKRLFNSHKRYLRLAIQNFADQTTRTANFLPTWLSSLTLLHRLYTLSL